MVEYMLRSVNAVGLNPLLTSFPIELPGQLQDAIEHPNTAESLLAEHDRQGKCIHTRNKYLVQEEQMFLIESKSNELMTRFL